MLKAIGVVSIMVLLTSGVSAVAQTTVEREATRMVTQSDAERLPDMTVGVQDAASELLVRRVPTVDWADSTFEEVMDWLRDQGEGRVNIVAKWGPLGVQSVGRETLVNLRLNNTTVAEVMNEVLDQISETGDVQYRGIGNKLTISTKQDFERKLYVRVYDITDLLFRIENFGENAPLIDLQNAGRSGGGGGGGGGQSVFQGSGGSGQERGASSQQQEQENEQRLTKLRELIEQTIAPQTWDTTTGQSSSSTILSGQGRIRVFNTSLVVLNTIEVHEMIAGEFSFNQ